ncbi:hypothetical protein CIB48_g1072 [Xylaria polymorpha]|nr:hypothetical protein CIB48_g1072 [Xylaria polymorpha]
MAAAAMIGASVRGGMPERHQPERHPGSIRGERLRPGKTVHTHHHCLALSFQTQRCHARAPCLASPRLTRRIRDVGSGMLYLLQSVTPPDYDGCGGNATRVA